MVKELRHVDIANNPDLVSLVEEVARTGESIVLQKDAIALATLVPAEAPRKKLAAKPSSEADLEAFRSSAGSWADIDVEAFMKYVYEGRQSSKPPIEL